jgi:hypothetical protein
MSTDASTLGMTVTDERADRPFRWRPSQVFAIGDNDCALAPHNNCLATTPGTIHPARHFLVPPFHP